MKLPKMLKPKSFDGGFVKIPWEMRLLQLNGLWPLKEGNNRNDVILINFILSFSCLCFVETIHAEMKFVYENRNNIFKVTECLCTTLIGTQILIRILHLTMKRTALRDLLIEFFKDIYITKIEYEEEHTKCEKDLIPTKCIAPNYIVTLTLMIILPIYAAISDPYSENKPYFYRMSFFYDAQKLGFYALTSLFTGWVGVASVSIIIADSFMISFMLSYCSGRYRWLQKELADLYENSVSSAKGGHSVYSTNSELDRKIYHNFVTGLKTIVCKHQKIDRCSASIEKVYSMTFFIIISFGTFLLCVIAFQLSTYGLSADTMKFFFWLMSSTFELCFLGRIGQIHSDSSEQLGLSYYMSNWESLLMHGNQKANAKLLKDLSFAIFRCQKPVELTGLKFINLSLPSIKAAVSTSVSYYMFLNTMKDRN